ncbi:unnamed protein product [Mytilus coruscus]|uniref:Integrase catalytic domain-containing protein n=1 Tax=Mytilus coruscus TaxID=42192 RepID=A0A6J8C4X0_MYTCO|nr:unnamed protein product [Mytilus coruscus]
MDQLKPPIALSIEGNVSENWRKWKQKFQFYLDATEFNEKAEKLQCSLLLHCIGEDAVEVFNTFNFVEDEKDKIAPLLLKFEQFCNPIKNQTYERYKFHTCSQSEGENIDHYATELKNRAKTCEFGQLCDSFVRDRIVCGILSDNVRERLLRIPDLTLAKSIDICRASEVSKQQLKSITEDEKTVHAMRKDYKSGHKPKVKHQYKDHRKDNPKGQKYDCKKCGMQHLPRSCPAFGKTCNQCKKPNHFKKMCKSRRIHAIEEESDSGEELYIGCIENQKKSENSWMVNLNLNGKNQKFKLETGAQANVIPYKVLKLVKGDTKIIPSKTRLVTYSGEKMDVLGKCYINVSHKDKIERMEFAVVNFNAQCILGLSACEKLNLINRVMSVEKSAESILKENSDLFDGIGELEGYHHIELDKSINPVIHPPRRVPIALQERLKSEIERMEKLGIVEKVEHPTEWVSSIVIVEKADGKLRICLDPKDLNRAIKREHFILPRQEEITAKLAGAKYFSKLDASSGFWNIKLDEESSNLCAFNTPFGRFKFLRLPFGIKSASEVFHKAVCKILHGLNGVESFIDDILVWGCTKEEHDKRLKEVLERIRTANLKLRRDKCEIGISEVTYFGHRYTREGLKIDDNKVKAITEMKSPTTKKELERFLGMVTYIAKFVPNFSSNTAVLRDLLKKDVPFQWDDNHDKTFKDLKTLITNSPVLRYFNSTKPVKLSVDASQNGLGAVLLQKELPIEYASRALTTSQKNWAQIEKELYAIVFGCERFHQYVYGRTIEVETDHKPLEAIFKKPLVNAPPRIQKLMLRLQKYDINVVYKPGKLMYISDTLSRAYLNEFDNSCDKDIDAQVHLLVKHVSVSESKMDEFRRETDCDDTLTELKKTVKDGWPESKSEINDKIKPYWDYREEIHEAQGLVFKGEKIVVPFALRKEMLQRIHEGHQGIERCKNRARDVLFWPAMSKQIEDVVQSCDICRRFQNSNAKEPMIKAELPSRPWEKVATDVFDFKNRQYLLIVDYYSKFFEVSMLNNLTSDTVMMNMKSIFARHGIPEVLVSDNARYYTSSKFQEFAKSWEFNHITSSPRYQQSNGLAERTVQTVKQLLKKAEYEGKDPYMSILNFRNTPLDSDIPSPSQLLMGRRCKTKLPITKKLLRTEVPENAKKTFVKKKRNRNCIMIRKQKNYQN